MDCDNVLYSVSAASQRVSPHVLKWLTVAIRARRHISRVSMASVILSRRYFKSFGFAVYIFSFTLRLMISVWWLWKRLSGSFSSNTSAQFDMETTSTAHNLWRQPIIKLYLERHHKHVHEVCMNIQTSCFEHGDVKFSKHKIIPELSTLEPI
jgi:ABC-type nickel/cobalt efflux system permease component RcnA